MPGRPVEPLPSGSDAAFRALFEQEVVGVGQADTSGHIVSANARLGHMLGYAPGDLLGLTFDEITHPDSRPESNRKLMFLIEGGASYVIEKEFVRKDGDSIWGVANVTAVRDESGRVSSLLAFVVDITERKRAARVFRRMQRSRKSRAGERAARPRPGRQFFAELRPAAARRHGLVARVFARRRGRRRRARRRAVAARVSRSFGALVRHPNARA